MYSLIEEFNTTYYFYSGLPKELSNLDCTHKIKRLRFGQKQPPYF